MTYIKDVAGSAAISSRARFSSIHTKILFVALVLAAAMMLCPSGAIAQDDEFVKIHATIQDADSLVANHHPEAALKKYGQAAAALKEFQKNYPLWNKSVVAYRQSYVAQKIAALTSTGEAPAETSTSSSAVTAPAAKPVSKGPVKLLDAGAEPRVALRVHPKVGDKQAMAVTVKLGMDTKMGQMQGQQFKLPPITVTVESTVKDVSTNGDITYEMALRDANVTEDPTVPPQMIEGIKSGLGSLNGVKVNGVMSDRRVSKQVDVSVSGASNPQISQSLDQIKDASSKMSVALPEEPVGVGAKWEVKMPVKSQGMTMDLTLDYQVVSVEGDRVGTKITGTLRAANQKIVNPAAPGMTMDLTRLTGQATGTSTMDLTQLLPKEGDFGFQAELGMGINAGGQKQTLSTKVDLNIRFEGK